MPFDSFMTAALTKELSNRLTGLKVDKVCQPERDEVDLLFHAGARSRLVINCTASTPYMALSSGSRENPSVPPMMCMLLRKHLSRAKITSVSQVGFDRIIRITFDSGDELGFRKSKDLYCEMMGRGSNLIFADENNKILAAFRQNDITTKFGRVVMVGAPYEPMPLQDKIETLSCTQEAFVTALSHLPPDTRLDLAIQKSFTGFGKLTAREVVFRASGDAEALCGNVDHSKLWASFSQICDCVREGNFSPCLIYESEEAYENGATPIDFSFLNICQFGEDFYIKECECVSQAIEEYYLVRNEKERQKQHHNDIAQILKNCKNRLERKIAVQMQQMEDAKDAEKNRLFGDLIMQELYRIRRGDCSLLAMDYAVGTEHCIQLDPMLTPSQNAQHYYKEYAKKKTALVKLEEQIRIAQEEMEYANSVLASLEHATSSTDLEEIRQELSHWSYGRRLVTGLKKPQKKEGRAKPRQILLPSGNFCYIGMNHYQNDTISTHLAQKEDLWFHVKNYHGSHVLLKKQDGNGIHNEDIELCASYAAYFSEVGDSDRVEVDYTEARFLKKPNGSKPGFVTYKNHTTVIVPPRKPN